MARTAGNAPPATVRTLRRIGIWGAPQCGKTTFLAALHVAVMRSPEQILLYGADDNATDFLDLNTVMLTDQRRFPPASLAITQYSWTMRMETQVPIRRNLLRTSMVSVPMQLNIDVIDAPGRHFSSIPEGDEADTAGPQMWPGEEADAEDGEEALDVPEELIEHLTSCNGLLFLFDPVREQRSGDAYRYFNGTLLKIAQRSFGSGRGADLARLRHHVAVCVTKFDNPAVYTRAIRGGYRSHAQDDPHLFPRVHDDDAERFFMEICADTNRGNADLVYGSIKKFFEPTRVRYFVSSAIGFYLGRASRFIEADYKNVVVEADGKTRVRGAIHPINVVEPFLWLGQALAPSEGGRR